MPRAKTSLKGRNRIFFYFLILEVKSSSKGRNPVLFLFAGLEDFFMFAISYWHFLETYIMSDIYSIDITSPSKGVRVVRRGVGRQTIEFPSFTDAVDYLSTLSMMYFRNDN